MLPKAKTLQLLASRADCFVVDPFICVTVGEWLADRQAVLARVAASRLGPVLIVRSAGMAEDEAADLPPGSLRSEQNVPSGAPEVVAHAIDAVIASYERVAAARVAGSRNEVLIQQQLRDARIAGVVSSRDVALGGPYFTIEYDTSGRTDAVTAGRACERLYVFRDATSAPEPWAPIVAAARSVEGLLQCNELVIEFAVDPAGSVHVFQARRSRVGSSTGTAYDSHVATVIRNSRDVIRSRPLTVWSDMADWNPAEMLGDRAHPLDCALYGHLVTESTWTEARASLGYTDVRPRRLMEVVANKAYVDVAVAFESLTPASLPRALRERFVEDRLHALRENPQLHDKVELDLLFTCADVNDPPRTQTLLARGFTAREVRCIEQALVDLTTAVIGGSDRLFSEDLARRAALLRWRDEHPVPNDAASSPAELSEYVFAGLAKCRALGVYSFARLARLAFIARDLLARLAASGAVSEAWLEGFWRSVHTVAADLSTALSRLVNGIESSEVFYSQYGHLRPRTYDITSRRYDHLDLASLQAAPDRISSWPTTVTWPDAVSERIASAGLTFDTAHLLRFARRAIEERERAKFEFSRVLSDCLEAIAALGERLDMSRAELAFLDLSDLATARDASLGRADLRARWCETVVARRAAWDVAQHIRLPALIRNADDLVVVQDARPSPNFVGSGAVEGDVIVITAADRPSDLVVAGKIVAVEAADPGYDWLFAAGILALVTRFGGVASHMAIRCAEFGLPAAVGCGEELFRTVSGARRVRIDCQRREIAVLAR